MGESIGERLRRARLSQDITQDDVSKKIGVAKQTIHKYETGVITNIPSDKLELLATLYHTTPAYLMGWDDSDDDIRAIQRAAKKMSSQDKSKMLKLLKLTFEEAFTDENNKN